MIDKIMNSQYFYVNTLELFNDVLIDTKHKFFIYTNTGYINMARNAGNMCGVASYGTYPGV